MLHVASNEWKIQTFEIPVHMRYMQDLFFFLTSLPLGLRGPNQVYLSSWKQRTGSWSSRGPTSVDTTVFTSTVTAACPCGPRKWTWTVRTKEIQSGWERRLPRWEALSYCVLFKSGFPVQLKCHVTDTPESLKGAGIFSVATHFAVNAVKFQIWAVLSVNSAGQ